MENTPLPRYQKAIFYDTVLENFCKMLSLMRNSSKTFQHKTATILKQRYNHVIILGCSVKWRFF